MPEFVLEIGIEEMPARFAPQLRKEAVEILSRLLNEARLAADAPMAGATPRRLAVRVDNVPETQPLEEEVVTGPPARIAFDDAGKPTKAALGFCRSQGVEAADLYTLETDKGEYLAVRRQVGGKPALEILPEVCVKLISSLSFPKRMRWGATEFAFGRPIRWLLALLDEKVVEFELAGLHSGRLCYGHRVMGRGPWEVASAAQYYHVLRDQGAVVLDESERRDAVRIRGDELAEEKGGRVVWKDALLQEVVGLVEYPKPVLGRFDRDFLELPREVLLTSMESHQKCFGVQDEKGDLLPYFLCTLNLNPRSEDLVTKGWERVLKARLEDARFFWKADLKAGFDVWLEKLESVTFIGPIGTMADKSRRMERLAGLLADRIDPALKDTATRAGLLAKADLVTEMVGEFDTLQGIMGGIYAGRMGESPAAAQAVAEHYLPAGPESSVPSSLAGAVTALADKADTLAGCFGLDMIPTGAQDPYALRRQALGVSRILMEHGLRVGLDTIVSLAQEGYEGVEWKIPQERVFELLMDFFGQRLKALFTGQGFETRIVEAALGAGFSDVWALRRRIEALDEFRRRDGFEQAVLTFKRAANIIRKQGAEAGVELGEDVDPALLAEPQEKALAEKIAEIAPRFEQMWSSDDFEGLLNVLGELRPSVDDFFDNVMVMAEDESLRRNRLHLLQSLVSKLARLADFNALQV
ncbi:MAG: glycine--tRNA ligase subunit beta [Desulfovibrionaceae bacterium]